LKVSFEEAVRGSLIMLVGETGIGKTTLCPHADPEDDRDMLELLV
jgi:putative ribosome biogenesis GTPase RsgA